MQWRQFSKSYMATGLKSHVCMRTLFMLSSSVDSIILSQHTFPPLEPRYLWQLLYLAIPHIDASVRLKVNCVRGMMLWTLHLIQPQYANIYPLCCFILIMLSWWCKRLASNQHVTNFILHAIHSCEERLWWSDNHSAVPAPITSHIHTTKKLSFGPCFIIVKWDWVLLGPD